MYNSNPSKILALFLVIVISACNPYQQAKEAIEVKQKSDSLMNEFKKVNESITAANKAIQNKNDSIYRHFDSLQSGTGAISHQKK